MAKYLQTAPMYISYGCTVILLISLIIGISNFSKVNSALKTITFFVAGSFVIDLISKSHLFFDIGANTYLFTLLSLLEFIAFTTYYIQVIEMKNSVKIKLRIMQLIGALIIAGFAVKTFLSADIELIASISSHLKTTVHFLLILLALHLMINQLSQERKHVITFGMLLYYIGSIIIFLLLPKLIKTSVENSYLIWLINALLLFGFYATCLIELLKWKKNS